MANSGAGFLEWKSGQEPNIGILYLCWCCCCGLPFLFKFHYLRNVLRDEFGMDDSMHWLMIIIGIYGFYVTAKQVESLENAAGITRTSSMPWWLPVFVFFLWPVLMADLMKRINVLAAAKQQ